MVVVSSDLINSHLDEPKVEKMFGLLESDNEVQGYLRMANVMAVERLMYNDHGPVHSKIASGSALEIFGILTGKVTPTTVANGACSLEDAKVIVLCGAYLHDIGNVVHRVDHHIHGCIIASPILDRLLKKVYPREDALDLRLKSEILHAIFSHDEEVRCLSVEAGTAKVADGTDMAQGRARIPYKTGKVDIHSLSALSITKVEIEPGNRKPVRILVNMNNPAGVFQIEEVLERKIRTSGIEEHIEAVALQKGTEIKRTMLSRT
ncbi:MAG: HD domain-containing protein [Candidatus Bathyarchaeota archaeon]|nr:HD domain-containing protein [Candidatus Bathyarchaeota archaeon]MDH5779981.1 HD domain-containing protein [Candidatus Bathyarchaeota archaeon]